jgi:hypothetical protein
LAEEEEEELVVMVVEQVTRERKELKYEDTDA